MYKRRRLGVQANGQGWGLTCRKLFKNIKNRIERRLAKQDPECISGYGRYHNYLK